MFEKTWLYIQVTMFIRIINNGWGNNCLPCMGTCLPWFESGSTVIVNKTWYCQWRIQVRLHFVVHRWYSWGLALVKLMKELDDMRLEAFPLFWEPFPQMLKTLPNGLKLKLLLFLWGCVSLARVDAQWQVLDYHPCRIRTWGKEIFLQTPSNFTVVTDSQWS